MKVERPKKNKNETFLSMMFNQNPPQKTLHFLLQNLRRNCNLQVEINFTSKSYKLQV